MVETEIFPALLTGYGFFGRWEIPEQTQAAVLR